MEKTKPLKSETLMFMLMRESAAEDVARKWRDWLKEKNIWDESCDPESRVSKTIDGILNKRLPKKPLTTEECLAPALSEKARQSGSPAIRSLLEMGFNHMNPEERKRWYELSMSSMENLREGPFGTAIHKIIPWRVLGVLGYGAIFEWFKSDESGMLNEEDCERRVIDEALLPSDKTPLHSPALTIDLAERLDRAMRLGWDPNRDSAKDFNKNIVWELARGLYSPEKVVIALEKGCSPLLEMHGLEGKMPERLEEALRLIAKESWAAGIHAEKMSESADIISAYREKVILAASSSTPILENKLRRKI